MDVRRSLDEGAEPCLEDGLVAAATVKGVVNAMAEGALAEIGGPCQVALLIQAEEPHQVDQLAMPSFVTVW